MTPKKLLDKLEAEMHKASPENKLFYTAIYEGAARMHNCYLNKQRNYYASHRDHHNEYQREYRKNKAKEVDAGE